MSLEKFEQSAVLDKEAVAQQSEFSAEELDLMQAVMDSSNLEDTKSADKESVVPDGADDNQHPVATTAEIVEARERAANPHGFKEVS